MLALAEEAARDGARLIVLPEGTVPAYVLGNEPVDASQLAAAAADLAHLATTHGATIVYGGARIADGRTYNAANVIGPDGSDLDRERTMLAIFPHGGHARLSAYHRDRAMLGLS